MACGTSYERSGGRHQSSRSLMSQPCCTNSERIRKDFRSMAGLILTNGWGCRPLRASKRGHSFPRARRPGGSIADSARRCPHEGFARFGCFAVDTSPAWQSASAFARSGPSGRSCRRRRRCAVLSTGGSWTGAKFGKPSSLFSGSPSPPVQSKTRRTSKAATSFSRPNNKPLQSSFPSPSS